MQHDIRSGGSCSKIIYPKPSGSTNIMWVSIVALMQAEMCDVPVFSVNADVGGAWSVSILARVGEEYSQRQFDHRFINADE